MEKLKPRGTIRTAYDLDNDPYIFEATGEEAKHFVDILKAEDEGRLVVLPCKANERSDLISRQALKNTLTDWQMQYAEKDKDTERFETLGAVIDLVTGFPSKVGKWYDWSFTAFDGCTVWHRVCSVCGYKRDDDNLDKDTNFCPNCGAKMERSEDAQKTD